MVYIVLGVSGCGKTTIGKELAHVLDLPFYDADDYHPLENIAKMSAGQALNDQDRQPWLAKLALLIYQWEQEGGAVLACSALKESYRNILTTSCEAQFIHLKGSKETILKRMKAREHFMPLSLLNSQFETLEEPENAWTISIEQEPHNIIAEIQGSIYAH